MELPRIFALLVAAFFVSSVTCSPTTYYMDERCGLPIHMFGGSILLELTESSEYDPNMRCVVSVQSEELYMDRIMVKVLWIDVEDSVLCEYDRLKIYDGSSTFSRQLTGHFGICGDDAPSTVYKTTGSWVTFNFTSDMSGEDRGFKLLITGFDDSGICLDSSEYECSNGFCIDNDLECDGYNNCGDNSDELLCSLSTGGIVGITVGCLAGVFILAAFVILISRGSNSNRRVCGQARPIVTENSYLPGGQPYQVYGSPIAGQLPANNQLPPSYDTLYSTQVPFPGHAAGGNVKTAELQQY